MHHLTQAVSNSIKDQNWYGAISMALMLPDVCCRISDGQKTNGKKYAAWFDKYMGKNYKVNYTPNQLEMVRIHSTEEDYQNLLKGTRFSGNDCYALRCAFLHEGSGDITNQKARDILNEIKLVEPNQKMVLHGSIINNKLILHLDIFCQQMVDSIHDWESGLDKIQIDRYNSLLKVKDVFELGSSRTEW